MIFTQYDLGILGRKSPTNIYPSSDVVVENVAWGKVQYIFLSHSNKDAVLAKGFVNAVRAWGISVYIDLYDSTLSLPPSSRTASSLRKRIKHACHFILLATKHSVQESRWCPWELGCADGFDIPISIARTKDEAGIEWGSEYLQLYHSLELRKNHQNKLQLARMSPIGGLSNTLLLEHWCNSLML